MDQQHSLFNCPQCDTPITKPECACGFRYRPPHQPELQLQLSQRKPDDFPQGLVDYANA